MPPRTKPVADRITENVVVNPTTGCWIWPGRATNAGYCQLTVEKKSVLAHRLSYLTFVGPIATGMCVCHKCDVRACVRPDHLFLGTYQDNHHDMIHKGRNSRGEARPDAKLTEEAVKAIRVDTRIIKEIAEAYGVCMSVVGNVKTRKTWKHVA